MKWGYVGYHFLYCYINYCILCNEKANEKQKNKKKSELNRGNTTLQPSLTKLFVLPLISLLYKQCKSLLGSSCQQAVYKLTCVSSPQAYIVGVKGD
jgi:hypothetical protein